MGRDTLTLLPAPATTISGARARTFARSEAAALLQSEFEWIRGLSGVYALGYHSQLLSKPEHLPVLAHLAIDRR